MVTMIDRENLAPVVLFTYNRLDHTKQTIEALRNNVYAQETELYIYSDAPKNEAAQADVEAVRFYLSGVTGFKHVYISEREENWGLARNIIDGVTKIVKEHGQVIVLEDDIVTSSYFLPYMNEALARYKDNPQVMEISGYAYPICREGLPDSYFVQCGACWGWATWDRAWQKFVRNPEGVMERFTQDDIYHFTLEGKWNDVWRQLEANKSGKLYTWAVFWCAAIYLNDGLVLYPKDSLTMNAGMDGSGEHCAPTDVYTQTLAEKPLEGFPTEITESSVARARVGDFFHKQEPSAFRLWLHKIKVALIGDVPIRRFLGLEKA